MVTYTQTRHICTHLCDMFTKSPVVLPFADTHAHKCNHMHIDTLTYIPNHKNILISINTFNAPFMKYHLDTHIHTCIYIYAYI